MTIARLRRSEAERKLVCCSDLRVHLIRRREAGEKITESGGNSEDVTPVPIPNTVVKLFSADDTWRVTARESRTLPVFRKQPFGAAFFVRGAWNVERQGPAGSR